ncbi:MAG: shikimate kinase [Rubrobacter sp.]|nr:shikimate kinase [Rubrobacter sp.]
MDGPLAIVGYMGSGKSTVGRIVANELGWDFVDLDREIEHRAGRPIPEIFASSGEERFRDLEHLALLDALGGADRRVVACGGGIVIRTENRERLKDVATIFLEEDLRVLFARTRGAGRPLRATGYEEFEQRYTNRLPAYLEVSDLRVTVDGRSRRQVSEEISRWLSG